ncbi:MAG: hypothetical protein LBU19_11570 [Treponema sp.]|nr:hypothetical protein [Treponema sp.]
MGKHIDREIVIRALIFQDIDPSEDPGDVFIDGQFRGFFDDHHVDFQRL